MPTMAHSTGELAFVLIAALLLACAAAWMLAQRYRAAMQRLMRSPIVGEVRGPPVPPMPPLPDDAPPPLPVSLADNHRAALRLTLLLVGLSCLIAVSSASFWMLLSFPAEPFAPRRVAVLALMQLWPVLPVLGLVWHWSLWRLLGALALFCAVCFLVMLWRSIEPRPLELVLGLAVQIGPALAMITLMFMGSATRAVAPWLLPPLIGLMWASTLGIAGLGALVAQRSPLLIHLPSWLDPKAGIALFALLPWLLAWWPLRQFGRALARAYMQHRLSELLVMFTAVWAVSQVVQALTVASSVGWRGVVLLLPLLWIPCVVTIFGARRVPGRPPTLLVLRVFQHDAQVQALFDHVVGRWRLSGNTVLIAGTDLAERTLDGGDVFAFLDGELAARFIRSPADVAPRLAALDFVADADGRHRVNECYCHDTTWQHALHALVHVSDVALMDLRGFQAHNAGCRYELAALARSPRALRVVVLVDAQTDRIAAAEAVGKASPARFRWIDAAQIDAAKRREVLACLFAPAAP